MQGPHTNKATVLKIRDAVQNPKTIEVEILNYRKDGVAFWNNFLLLPVYSKNKKCHYFIAIQKNITVFKRNNPPRKWTAAEVAMWLENYGLFTFSQKIINHDITGRRFLKLNHQTALKIGIILRSEQDDILKAVHFLKEHTENPFINKKVKNNYYDPKLTEDSINLAVNTNEPGELSYWETEGSPNETILFKCYYRKEIFMLLWPMSTVSKDVIESEICTHFDLKNVKLHYIDVDISKKKPPITIYGDDTFNHIIQGTKGTVKFIVEEEEKDLLSMTSTLNNVPDSIFIVNDSLEILYSNKIANSIFNVKNASYLPNLTQILPELPVNFPKYPHIKTFMLTPNGNIPVEISVSVHGNSSFMFIIRPIEMEEKKKTFITNSFHSTLETYHTRSTENSFSDFTCESSDKELQINDPTDSDDSSFITPRKNKEVKQNIKRIVIPDESQSSSSSTSSGSMNQSLRSSSLDESHLNDSYSMKEGDKQKLGRTLDQILFSNSKNMIDLFISSYKLFHTKETVLDELIILFDYYFNERTSKILSKKKYNLTDDNESSVDILSTFSQNLCYLLQKWNDSYPNDFLSSSFRDQYLSLVEKLPNESANVKNSIKLQMIKTSSLRRDSLPSSLDRFTLGIISYTNSNDIANALTAKDMIIFKKIEPQEFYRCAWMKMDKFRSSPNILALSSSFDAITNWISVSILVDCIKTRAKRIQKFIDIAHRLLRLNNFQTMMAVVSALDLCHISRLKKSWAIVPQQSLNILKEMKSLMDSRHNFRNYRNALQNVIQSNSFGIPYMPVILRDLTFTYESLTDDCTYDNVEVVGKQLQIVWDLQARDLPLDDFKVKDSLLHFFSTMKPVADEEEMYRTSLLMEPALKAGSLDAICPPSPKGKFGQVTLL